MLRESVSRQTDLGKKVEKIMNKGDLVPDELMINLIKSKINEPVCNFGAILDGFPRTMEQAQKLDEFLKKDNHKIDKVFAFNMPDELLVERVTGRRLHKNSGRSYHIKFKPPKVEGKDDVTGEPLYHRKDDTEPILKNRLK